MQVNVYWLAIFSLTSKAACQHILIWSVGRLQTGTSQTVVILDSVGAPGKNSQPPSAFSIIILQIFCQQQQSYNITNKTLQMAIFFFPKGSQSSPTVALLNFDTAVVERLLALGSPHQPGASNSCRLCLVAKHASARKQKGDVTSLLLFMDIPIHCCSCIRC